MDEYQTLEDVIKAAKAGKVQVLDVREPGEVAQSGKAKGAVHIPLAGVVNRGNPKAGELSLDKPVFVYCAAGMRAQKACEVLQGFGYSVGNIGGFGDWAATGGPVTKG